MNGISGSESNIFIERALTWINASAHGNESVCIWGIYLRIDTLFLPSLTARLSFFLPPCTIANCCCDWQLPFRAEPSSVINRRSLRRSDRVRRPSNSEASLVRPPSSPRGVAPLPFFAGAYGGSEMWAKRDTTCSWTVGWALSRAIGTRPVRVPIQDGPCPLTNGAVHEGAGCGESRRQALVLFHSPGTQRSENRWRRFFIFGSDQYLDQGLVGCRLSTTHEASTTACAPIRHGRRSRRPCGGRPERPVVCRG